MNKKILFIGFGFSIASFVVIISLFSIQILQGEKNRRASLETISRTYSINARRGRIYDRAYDTPLVHNSVRYSVIADKEILDEYYSKDYLTILFNDMKIRPEIISRYHQGKKENDHTLLDNLSYDELAERITQINRHRGLTWERHSNRTYTYGSQMAHVLGYIGRISPRDLETRAPQGYSGNELVGKNGIELMYEEVLRGSLGKESQIVDVLGKKLEKGNTLVESARPGFDIILTIDASYQKVLEEALGKRTGAAVLMRAETGEILAMASYPTFNPNILSNNKNLKLITSIQNDKTSPLLNRTIQSHVPPASTFKIVTLFAFLNEHPKLWETEFSCPAYVQIGNRKFYNWRRYNDGRQPLDTGFANSCNTIFYTLGIQYLGVEKIFDYASLLGLNKITNIGLPWEEAGIIPSRSWKYSRFGEIWQDGDTANLAIGQGYVTVTPLQMAQMLSTIVNYGVTYQPQLIKQIVDSISKKVVKDFAPIVMTEMNIDKPVFEYMHKALQKVVTHGTVKNVITASIPVAGKTGTAQTESSFENTHSWFVSYSPDPTDEKQHLVLSVWIDGSNEWEYWGPRASNIVYNHLATQRSIEDKHEAN